MTVPLIKSTFLSYGLLQNWHKLMSCSNLFVCSHHHFFRCGFVNYQLSLICARYTDRIWGERIWMITWKSQTLQLRVRDTICWRAHLNFNNHDWHSFVIRVTCLWHMLALFNCFESSSRNVGLKLVLCLNPSDWMTKSFVPASSTSFHQSRFFIYHRCCSNCKNVDFA